GGRRGRTGGEEWGGRGGGAPPQRRRDQMTPGVGTEGRDAERTPMQWDSSPSAGFTTEGVTPWLPYGDNAQRNVADQRDDPGSTLRFCRDLLALRRGEVGGGSTPSKKRPPSPGAGGLPGRRVLGAAT